MRTASACARVRVWFSSGLQRIHVSRDRGGTFNGTSTAEDLCSTLARRNGARWGGTRAAVNVQHPCATTALVQLHGDAETWMHPVGEYNELEPELLSGSMAHGFALPSRTPALFTPVVSFLLPSPSPPPALPPLLTLFRSFSVCLSRSVSPGLAPLHPHYLSFQSSHPRPLHPCAPPRAYASTPARVTFKFRTSQPTRAVRHHPPLTCGTAAWLHWRRKRFDGCFSFSFFFCF